MSVVTRFAPSPTGYLHIGGVRTALFNWLFAKHHGGKYLLRIEDTDQQRSTPEAVDLIFKTLDWLGLKGDSEPVFQFSRAQRHAQVAHELVKKGQAYYCYCTPQELEEMRAQAKLQGKPMGYNGYWRERDPDLAPKDVKPVVRLKAPREGETVIHDLVQGTVRVQNTQLDDFVLLRSDGTPTYMLSVVVDDHDMEVTHIIRGDDHLTNAFRQTHLYKAMGWTVPHFAHIPLIHGMDGQKLSKRHGALGAESYKEQGFLPEALLNYLLRLGWAHGDEEYIPKDRAIELFDLDGVGKSPSRFDIQKLQNLNGQYIRDKDNADLLTDLKGFLPTLDASQEEIILKGLDGLKTRAKTLVELANGSDIYLKEPSFEHLDEKSLSFYTSTTKELVKNLTDILETKDCFDHTTLEKTIREFCEEHSLKMGAVAQPLRVALTGSTVSPSVFDIMEVLGKQHSIKRLRQFSA